MKLTAYHANYHKYGAIEVTDTIQAEQALNFLYHTQSIKANRPPLFKIDNSEMMTYNEARIALGFKPDKYAR